MYYIGGGAVRDLMCLNCLAGSRRRCLSAGFPTPGMDSLLWTAIQGRHCPRTDQVRPCRPRATHSKYPNESWNVICTRMVTSTSVTSEFYSSRLGRTPQAACLTAFPRWIFFRKVRKMLHQHNQLDEHYTFYTNTEEIMEQKKGNTTGHSEEQFPLEESLLL